VYLCAGNLFASWFFSFAFFLSSQGAVLWALFCIAADRLRGRFGKVCFALECCGGGCAAGADEREKPQNPTKKERAQSFAKGHCDF